MTSSDWSAVRSVRVDLAATVGSATVRRCIEVIGGAVMRRREPSAGYAMLAVLLIMVLAATFALVVVGAVRSLQVVEGADAAGWRATAAERRALAAVVRTLRWHPLATTGAAQGGDAAAAGSWRVSWMPAPAASATGWPCVAAQTVTAAGRASHRDDLALELRSEQWAMGVTCVGRTPKWPLRSPSRGAASTSAVRLRGRENVRFVQGAGSPHASRRAGRRRSRRSVPCRRGPRRTGHLRPRCRDPRRVLPGRVPRRHRPARRGAGAGRVAERGLRRVPAGRGGRGDVAGTGADRRAPAAGRDRAGDGDELAGGRCLLPPAGGRGASSRGSPPADVGRLLVVVRGDVVLGRPGETLGALRRNRRQWASGSPWAGGRRGLGPRPKLQHRRSHEYLVPPAWRERCLPGAVSPTLMACGT